jgi:hypothetical protein
MSLTNYGENRILELFKDAGTYYVGLFTVSPSEGGGGTEVGAGGYARQKVTFGSAAGGAMSNSAAIEFPAATADWGTATAWALFDAATGGNMLWYGDITVPKALYSGDIYRVSANNLTLTMD